jgi:hypothetical protein
MTDRDLETVALKTQMEILGHRWRSAAAEARAKAETPPVSEEANYLTGYADAMDRCVQSLRELEEQW